MKVVFLAYAALCFGNYYYIFQLTKELRKMGVDVEIIRAPFHIKTFGTPIFYLRYSFLSNYLKKFDIVHSSEGAGIAIIHENIVETYHHDYRANGGIGSLLFSLLEDIACKKAKRIIVPSYATYNCLVRYGHPKDKIHVIYHGVDHEIFRLDKCMREEIRSKYKINNFTLITVGQLIKRKNHVDILRALSLLKGKLTLIIVGHGSEKNRILSLAKKYGIRVLHFEFIPRKVLVGLYNASDVYVHTSMLEGFGMTILEAMSCGLPIIAYETADLSKIVSNAGFILKQGDVLKLKEAIELLWHDEKLRRRLKSEALKQSNKFTWKESALKYVQLYKEILEKWY